MRNRKRKKQTQKQVPRKKVKSRGQGPAEATTALTELIVAESAVNGGPCIGGLVFEWTDEWHKAGNPDVHDTGGAVPDHVFKEEWWGLVEVDGTPREAFAAVESLTAQAP